MTLDYKIMEGSLYNTPPCWSIYVCGLVFKHLLAAGGLSGVKANNDAKAKLVPYLPAPLHSLCDMYGVRLPWQSICPLCRLGHPLLSQLPQQSLLRGVLVLDLESVLPTCFHHMI